MKLLKHTCGFTLVEALVVSVIVAIVGIAAVVTYSGYIKESRRQAVEGIADAAAVAANAYVRKVGNDAGLDATKLGLFLPNPGAYTVTVDINDANGPHGSVNVVDNKYTEIEATKYY